MPFRCVRAETIGDQNVAHTITTGSQETAKRMMNTNQGTYGGGYGAGTYGQRMYRSGMYGQGGMGYGAQGFRGYGPGRTGVSYGPGPGHGGTCYGTAYRRG